MISVFASAWRVILKRTRADWLILAAATLIILLATSLLSAGPTYAGAVAVSGLHRTLNDAPTAEANVQVEARLRSSDFRAFDDTVVSVAGDALQATGGPIVRLGVSDSFALPNQDDVRDLAVFSFYDRIQEHATIVDGAWPDTVDGVVEAAIPEPAAALLELSPGDEIVLTNRRDAELTALVRVTGIYQVNNTVDPFWWDNPLEIGGVEEGESFTTYGPFVVTAGTFFSPLVTSGSSNVLWRIYPVFEELDVAEVGSTRRGVEGLQSGLNRAAGVENRFSVETQLDDLLRDAERSLLVTRTGVMILTVQLAVLAGYALVLTAGLLIEQRRVETSLLRSRGASDGQIAAMALMEGVALAVPAAVVGPWLAAWSLRLLNIWGPLTGIDLELDPIVTRGAYILAGLAAIGCVVALVLPAFLAARSFVEARSSKGRQGARGFAQRGGVDLALLVIAALAYWQLRRYGAPITETVQGRLGLDPFLVAAPAIGLLAGAVIALRLIPILTRTLDRIVTTRRTVVPSLGAWQVARRPARYARSAMLMMLALAIGLFAISYTQTWTRSQRDQADYQTGADFRVAPDRRVGSSIPGMLLANSYARIEGVTGSMPVRRETMTVSRSGGTGEMIALDATQASGIVAFREDLAGATLAELMGGLEDGRPNLPSIPLDGDPRRIAVDLAIELDPVSEDGATSLAPTLQPFASVVLQDARGMIYRLEGGPVAVDSGTQRFIIALTPETTDIEATPIYPLAIVGLDVRLLVPEGVAREGMLTVTSISHSPSLAGDDWTPVSLDADDWSFTVASVSAVSERPEIEAVDAPDAGLEASFSTGFLESNLLMPLVYQLRPAGVREARAIPILASEDFLAATEARVGDTIQTDIAGDRRQVVISGSFTHFPTTGAQRAGVAVVDLPTIAAIEFWEDGRVLDADEWWLNGSEARSDTIAETLRDAPYSSWRVYDRFDRSEVLRTDPVALGIIGALTLGFVAAAIFATVGFVVSAVVSARERVTEFGLLRALGLSPRQLSGWLSLENGLLVGLSLMGGTTLGLALAWFILPFVTLTQSATEVVPGIIVTIPWRTILLLELTTIVVLAGVVLVLGLLLRRSGLGTVLRMGED